MDSQVIYIAQASIVSWKRPPKQADQSSQVFSVYHLGGLVDYCCFSYFLCHRNVSTSLISQAEPSLNHRSEACFFDDQSFKTHTCDVWCRLLMTIHQDGTSRSALVNVIAEEHSRCPITFWLLRIPHCQFFHRIRIRNHVGRSRDLCESELQFQCILWIGGTVLQNSHAGHFTFDEINFIGVEGHTIGDPGTSSARRLTFHEQHRPSNVHPQVIHLPAFDSSSRHQHSDNVLEHGKGIFVLVHICNVSPAISSKQMMTGNQSIIQTCGFINAKARARFNNIAMFNVKLSVALLKEPDHLWSYADDILRHCKLTIPKTIQTGWTSIHQRENVFHFDLAIVQTIICNL